MPGSVADRQTGAPNGGASRTSLSEPGATAGPRVYQLSTVRTQRRVTPRPNNAEALALVASFGGPPLPDDEFPVWEGSSGVMPRFALAAAGWTGPGDRLRAPSDAAWWSAPYRFGSQLYAHLEELARTSDAYVRALLDPGEPAPIPVYHVDIARGEPAAIAQELASVADVLAEMKADGTDARPPFLWGPGGRPVPNPRQLPAAWCAKYPRYCKGGKVDPGKLPLPRIPRPRVPWWLVVGLAWVLMRDRK